MTCVMVKPKQPAGPAMTLGNMRELGVQNLIAFCFNDACRYQALIDVWFRPRVKCVEWGSRSGI